MQSQEFVTAGRVAEKSVEKLWGEATHPSGRREMVAFDQEVIWIEETEAVVAFMHGGEEVETFGTYSDFYGYGTSVCGKGGAIGTARRIADRFNVTPESTAEVVVRQTTFLIPAIPATSRDALELNAKADADPKWKRKFAHLPEGWRLRREETLESGEVHVSWPRPERRILKEEVVWQVGGGLGTIEERKGEDEKAA
jgi:hypothetical protein